MANNLTIENGNEFKSNSVSRRNNGGNYNYLLNTFSKEFLCVIKIRLFIFIIQIYFNQIMLSKEVLIN